MIKHLNILQRLPCWKKNKPPVQRKLGRPGKKRGQNLSSQDLRHNFNLKLEAGIVHPPSSMSVFFWILLKLEVSHLSVVFCVFLFFSVLCVLSWKSSGLGPKPVSPACAISPSNALQSSFKSSLPETCKLLRFIVWVLAIRGDNSSQTPPKLNAMHILVIGKKYIYTIDIHHVVWTCLNHPNWWLCVACVASLQIFEASFKRLASRRPFLQIGSSRLTFLLVFSNKIILPETNITPENECLEDYFPFGKAYFQGLLLLVSGKVIIFWPKTLKTKRLKTSHTQSLEAQA